MLNAATACRFLGLLGLGFVAYGAYHAFPARRAPGTNEQSMPDFLCEVLGVAIVANLAAYVLGHEAIDQATMRYVVPAFIFGAILAGRCVVERAGTVSRPYPGIAVVAVVYAAFFGKGQLSPLAANPFVDLAGWLSRKNLEYGYGTYWASSITTVSSENRVKVRAVIPVGEHLKPKQWLTTGAGIGTRRRTFWSSGRPMMSILTSPSNWRRPPAPSGHPRRSPGWESIRC